MNLLLGIRLAVADGREAAARASGVRLGELRQIVLLETGIPLLFTVLAGIALALLVAFVAVPLDSGRCRPVASSSPPARRCWPRSR